MHTVCGQGENHAGKQRHVVRDAMQPAADDGQSTLVENLHTKDFGAVKRFNPDLRGGAPADQPSTPSAAPAPSLPLRPPPRLTAIELVEGARAWSRKAAT
jgi:hypothetical protein